MKNHKKNNKINPSHLLTLKLDRFALYLLSSTFKYGFMVSFIFFKSFRSWMFLSMMRGFSLCLDISSGKCILIDENRGSFPILNWWLFTWLKIFFFGCAWMKDCRIRKMANLVLYYWNFLEIWKKHHPLSFHSHRPSLSYKRKGQDSSSYHYFSHSARFYIKSYLHHSSKSSFYKIYRYLFVSSWSWPITFIVT